MPCFFYNSTNCPLFKRNHTTSDKKFISRCSSNIDDDSCYPSFQNQNIPIESCESLSLYGKNICNNTFYKDNEKCKFNELMNKCK